VTWDPKRSVTPYMRPYEIPLPALDSDLTRAITYSFDDGQVLGRDHYA
jgi:hypothetical protein